MGYNPVASAMGLDTTETNPAVLKKMAERKKRQQSKRVKDARHRGRVGGQGFEDFGRGGKRSSTAPQPRRPSSDKLPDISAPRTPLDEMDENQYDDDEVDFASTSPSGGGGGGFGEAIDEPRAPEPQEEDASFMSRQERAAALHRSKRERMALAEEKRRRRELGEEDAAKQEDDFVAFSAQGRRQQQQRARDVAQVAKHVGHGSPHQPQAAAGGGGSSYKYMEAERTIAELRQQLVDAPGRAAAAAKAEMLSAKRAAKDARRKCTELGARVAELEESLSKERAEKTKLARRLAVERKKQPLVEEGGKRSAEGRRGPGSEAEFDERAARVLANAKQAAAATVDTATRARATIAAAAATSAANRPAPKVAPEPPTHGSSAESAGPPQMSDYGLENYEGVLGSSPAQQPSEPLPQTPPLADSPTTKDNTEPAGTVEPEVSSIAATSAQPPLARRGRAAAQPGGRRARRQEQTPHKVASPAPRQEAPPSPEPEPEPAAESPEPEAELTGEWALPQEEEPLAIERALAQAGQLEDDEPDDALTMLRQRHAREAAAREAATHEAEPEPEPAASPTNESEDGSGPNPGGITVSSWGGAGGDMLAPSALLEGAPDTSLMAGDYFNTDGSGEMDDAMGMSPATNIVNGAIEDALSEAT